MLRKLKEEKDSRRRINRNDDKTKDIQNKSNINRRYGANTGGHKYSLRRYYKDYFAIKKRKEETQ
ncbi:MAG TPA: hypothetical protein VJ729_02410 [Nitrososphaeraceae archaeon]|nr:hypothetical protein [Nitrososphaeraceae archaeon]